MRILITGAHGFVGQHVVQELQDEHELITPSSRELNLVHPTACSGVGGEVSVHYGYPIPPGYPQLAWTSEGVQPLMFYLWEHKVDAIVHLAATCGGIGINKDNPGKFIYDNLQMGINVLEAARLTGIKKVVNLGSVCAYPKFTPVPFEERELWNGYPEETNAPYGIAKKTIIEMSRAYHQQYGLNVTNLLPANMYGEYDNFDLYSSHVIPALIKKFEDCYEQAEYHGDFDMITKDGITLWGTGDASREFLYAGDLARAIAVSLDRNTGPEPINIGTGEEISISDLANLIKEVGGYEAKIHWDNSQPDGQPRRSLDITRAKNVLRWEPRVSLREGLSRVIDWYKDERENSQKSSESR